MKTKTDTKNLLAALAMSNFLELWKYRNDEHKNLLIISYCKTRKQLNKGKKQKDVTSLHKMQQANSTFSTK